MYVQVSLLNGYSQPLWYAVPQNYRKNIFIGTLVQVPLQKRIEHAIVLEVKNERPCDASFVIKEILAIEMLPADKDYYAFVSQVAHSYHYLVAQLLKRMRLFLNQPHEQMSQKEDELQILKQESFLTDEQQRIVAFVSPIIKQGFYQPVVLHGITGSGKTHVYKELIIKALREQKTVLLLLPEVRLAMHFQQQLTHFLPTGTLLFGFHSASAVSEKKAAWHALHTAQVCVIIGVHLPIMLPIINLGLILIDEEHDPSYQEKQLPRIHTREVALLRARIYGVPIVLGSATPSLLTLYRTRVYKWPFFQLTKRFSGALPVIRTVFLTKNKERPFFWITHELKKEIQARLLQKEQTIIFLNRRGYSFFVQCSVCSLIFSCKHCSVSLTLHENNSLMCHYCGYVQKLPTECIECKATSDLFLKKGVGTQQAVTMLKELFPKAVIARADMDSSARKKEWQKTISDFKKGYIDILVGTQTIAKGFHFPRVTLIGILWADVNLHFPVYHAAEVALQQLIQVAGRAGRESLQSTVIVQACSDHSIFSHVSEIEYLAFYKTEIAARKMLGYPPIGYLFEVTVSHAKETIVKADAEFFAFFLKKIASVIIDEKVQILGPSCPPVYKIKSRYTWNIYIKGTSFDILSMLYKEAFKARLWKASIQVTPSHLDIS